MTETAYSQRIDSHHHLWHYTPEEYGWIGDDMTPLRRDFLLDDLRRELADAGVDGTVAVQARQTLEETAWLLDLAEGDDSPLRGVVGWLPIASTRFPAVLESFRDSKRLCGLRHIVQGEQPGFLDGDAFNQGIAHLRDTGLVYDILIYARQLEEATRFVDRHPAQSFVLDHIAKPDIRNDGFVAWAGAFRELAQRENVMCKLSGMVTETDWNHWSSTELHPYFETALEAFSPHRLMMGTDWPVLTVGCTYSGWWKTVENWTAALSAQERDMILGGTASRIYNLRS
jgi:L-fuconolactonase